MDKDTARLLDFLGYEADTIAWEPLFKPLFENLTFETLPDARDISGRIILDLIEKEDARKIINPAELCDYLVFDADNLAVKATEPLIVELLGMDALIQPYKNLTKKEKDDLDALSRLQQFAGVRLGKRKFFIGENAIIQGSTLAEHLYLGADAKLMRTYVGAGPKASLYASYIAPGSIVEEADQFSRAIIGGRVNNPYTGYQRAYYHGDSALGIIIGGSSAVSDGCTTQSHMTGKYDRVYFHDFNKEIKGENVTKIPSFIGVDCSIGAGTMIVAPTIVQKQMTIGEEKILEKYQDASGIIFQYVRNSGSLPYSKVLCGVYKKMREGFHHFPNDR